MNYNSITKYDLGEPYDILIEELEFEDIIKLQELYLSQQINFSKNYRKKLAEGDFKELVELLGEKKATFVLRQFSGLRVYFTDIKRSLKKKIHSLIIKEFNGYNHKELASKYDYSTRSVYRIINSNKA